MYVDKYVCNTVYQVNDVTMWGKSHDEAVKLTT